MRSSSRVTELNGAIWSSPSQASTGSSGRDFMRPVCNDPAPGVTSPLRPVHRAWLCVSLYDWEMAARPGEIIRFIGRSSKRIAVSVVGAAFVLAGLVMLVLPGPGILVVVIGFAILGTEYAWAAAALERTKRLAAGAGVLARDGVTRAARGAHGTARSVGRRFRQR